MSSSERRQDSRRSNARRLGSFDRWGEPIRLRRRESGAFCVSQVMSSQDGEVLVHLAGSSLPAVNERVDVLFEGSIRPLEAVIQQIDADGEGGGVARLEIAEDTRLGSRRRGASGRRDIDRTRSSDAAPAHG